ncbi:hypothetical protein ACHMW5_34605 [Azospirillum melinis]|uniref:hypothetical protein n=1 Tax=Azospirillum melinis TaxID=328839 RepID=UPI00375780AB
MRKAVLVPAFMAVLRGSSSALTGIAAGDGDTVRIELRQEEPRMREPCQKTSEVRTQASLGGLRYSLDGDLIEDLQCVLRRIYFWKIYEAGIFEISVRIFP